MGSKELKSYVPVISYPKRGGIVMEGLRGDSLEEVVQYTISDERKLVSATAAVSGFELDCCL
jgi:hypothetical protein